MSKKPKRKVKLPLDRTGAPITIGDVLEWYGGGFWCATDCSQDDGSDNLGASVIVARKAVKR